MRYTRQFNAEALNCQWALMLANRMKIEEQFRREMIASYERNGKETG